MNITSNIDFAIQDLADAYEMDLDLLLSRAYYRHKQDIVIYRVAIVDVLYNDYLITTSELNTHLKLSPKNHGTIYTLLGKKEYYEDMEFKKYNKIKNKFKELIEFNIKN